MRANPAASSMRRAVFCRRTGAPKRKSGVGGWTAEAVRGLFPLLTFVVHVHWGPQRLCTCPSARLARERAPAIAVTSVPCCGRCQKYARSPGVQSIYSTATACTLSGQCSGTGSGSRFAALFIHLRTCDAMAGLHASERQLVLTSVFGFESASIPRDDTSAVPLHRRLGQRS